MQKDKHATRLSVSLAFTTLTFFSSMTANAVPLDLSFFETFGRPDTTIAEVNIATMQSQWSLAAGARTVAEPAINNSANLINALHAKVLVLDLALHQLDAVFAVAPTAALSVVNGATANINDGDLAAAEVAILELDIASGNLGAVAGLALTPTADLSNGVALYADVRSDALVAQAAIVAAVGEFGSTLASAVDLNADLTTLLADLQAVIVRASAAGAQLIAEAPSLGADSAAVNAAGLNLLHAADNLRDIPSVLLGGSAAAISLSSAATSLFTSGADALTAFSDALANPLVTVEYSFAAAEPIISSEFDCGFIGSITGNNSSTLGLGALENDIVATFGLELTELAADATGVCNESIFVSATRTISGVPELGEVVNTGVAAIDFSYLVYPNEPCAIAFEGYTDGETGEEIPPVCFEEFHMPQFGLELYVDPLVGATATFGITGSIGSPFEITGIVLGNGENGFDGFFEVPVSVPAPPTLLLLLLGLAIRGRSKVPE